MFIEFELTLNILYGFYFIFSPHQGGANHMANNKPLHETCVLLHPQTLTATAPLQLAAGRPWIPSGSAHKNRTPALVIRGMCLTQFPYR